MATGLPVYEENRTPDASRESLSSGVSWAAVLGGAVAAAALSLVLLALGAGLGLSSVSPWSNVGVSASTLGTATIVWLLVMALLASAMGGYLTGRLRTKWAVIHTDEVYFRDTANGFLSWAVALVLTATVLVSAAVAMVGGAARRAPEGAETALSSADPNAYFVDTLFGTDHPATDQSVAAQGEAGRALVHALAQPEIPAADKNRLVALVAARTGMSRPEAEQRVNEVVTAAQQAADRARKTTARLLLWTFVALMLGALSASYTATIGGRQRDHVRPV
jgi:hypothetical protein